MPVNFEQNLRFRHVPEKPVEEFDFVGGLITDAHETKLQTNQSPDMANILFNDTGSITTRNGYRRYNTTPIGAAADQSNTGASTGSIALDAPGDFVAQTYQPSGAIDVLQVDLYLAMQTSGQEQLVQAQLWSTSGSAPSAVLTGGVGQILLVSGTSETAYSFRFRISAANAAATTYAVVLKPFVRGSSQTVNQVNVYHRGTTYANGNVYTSTDSGLNWTSDTAKDLRFVVYAGGSTGGTGLIRYYNTMGDKQLFSKVGSTLSRGDDGTGVMTTITLGSGATLNSANYLAHTISNDTLLTVDDAGFIQKYRGSTNSNYTTGTVSVTNDLATVTGSGTSWATSTNAEVDEYIKLPDGKWYLITAIASNTSLTIERAYTGSSTSGQAYTISPWGEVQGALNSASAPTSLVRPTPSDIETHIDRVWTLEDNLLRFSTLDTSVDEENFNDWDTASNAGAINIPGGKGDNGVRIYSLNNTLFVFQRRATWRLYGNSPGNFELRNVSNEIGMVNPRTLVEWNDILIFQSEKGVIMFDGSNFRNITEGVINTMIASWANKTSPSATLWDNRYIISYTPSGGSYNSEALFYDIVRGVWGKTEGVYANVWSNWDGGNDTGELYFISSNQGSIYRWDTGGHDDGYEIETRYSTGSWGFGGNVNNKSFKKFYIQQIALGDWNMTVTMSTNLGETETPSTINLAGGSSALWDVAQWDVDSWPSEATLLQTRIPEFQGLGNYFKYIFSQTGYDEGVEILGVLATARERRLT